MSEKLNRFVSFWEKEYYSKSVSFCKIVLSAIIRNLLAVGLMKIIQWDILTSRDSGQVLQDHFISTIFSEERKSEPEDLSFPGNGWNLLSPTRELNPTASDETISSIISETRKAGGLFVSIWHNTSLLDNTEWKKWGKHF